MDRATGMASCASSNPLDGLGCGGGGNEAAPPPRLNSCTSDPDGDGYLPSPSPSSLQLLPAYAEHILILKKEQHFTQKISILSVAARYGALLSVGVAFLWLIAIFCSAAGSQHIIIYIFAFASTQIVFSPLPFYLYG